MLTGGVLVAVNFFTVWNVWLVFVVFVAASCSCGYRPGFLPMALAVALCSTSYIDCASATGSFFRLHLTAAQHCTASFFITAMLNELLLPRVQLLCGW